jgi:hypothetical protein
MIQKFCAAIGESGGTVPGTSKGEISSAARLWKSKRQLAARKIGEYATGLRCNSGPVDFLAF